MESCYWFETYGQVIAIIKSKHLPGYSSFSFFLFFFFLQAKHDRFSIASKIGYLVVCFAVWPPHTFSIICLATVIAFATSSRISFYQKSLSVNRQATCFLSHSLERVCKPLKWSSVENIDLPFIIVLIISNEWGNARWIQDGKR